MGYEPNGRIEYMHNYPRTGISQIPTNVEQYGDRVEVLEAWDEYVRDVAGYGISISTVGTLFSIIVAVFSCAACAQVLCFKTEFFMKPSLFPRMVGIWSFAALIGAAALVSIITPISVRNIGQAYVDGLDTGIDFLEISVHLGNEVASIGDGLDNMTTAANSINNELRRYPEAQELRTAINDFIGAVSDSSEDVRESGGDIADSTKDARQSLVDLRDTNQREQIIRGGISSSILHFLFFVAFAVAGTLPFLPTIMPIAHKFLTGITCCCCVLPTFWIAGLLGIIGMIGSDVCIDIEDTLVALIEFDYDVRTDDPIDGALSSTSACDEETECSFGDRSGFESFAGSIAAKGAWYAVDAAGLPVSEWLLEFDESVIAGNNGRTLQENDDNIIPLDDDDIPSDTGVDALKYYLKCHESPPPPLPRVLATARDGANTFYYTSNQLDNIIDRLEKNFTQRIPELEDLIVTMRTGFLTINESVADTMDLFLCDGVNYPIYNFISIVCNDAVGNGIVLAFYLMAGTAFMALIGMVPNLFILARHPAEEYKEPQAVSITVNMVDGVQPNPVIGYEDQAGGYPGGSAYAAPASQPEYQGLGKPPTAPIAAVGQPADETGKSPFLAQPPASAGFAKQEPL